jgi:hypothetical protein
MDVRRFDRTFPKKINELSSHPTLSCSSSICFDQGERIETMSTSLFAFPFRSERIDSLSNNKRVEEHLQRSLPLVCLFRCVSSFPFPCGSTISLNVRGNQNWSDLFDQPSACPTRRRVRLENCFDSFGSKRSSSVHSSSMSFNEISDSLIPINAT